MTIVGFQQGYRTSRASARVLGVTLLSSALSSCSPVARVRSRLDVPASIRDPDRERLHLRVATSDTAGPLAAPSPGREPPRQVLTAKIKVDPVASGFETELRFREAQIYVNFTAWYDTNGNGAVDAGDAVGSLGPDPILAVDRGLFSGNLTVTPPIALKPVP
jgi:hypothetical protein